MTHHTHPLRYYLSGRQAKELARGQQLQIALPHPGDLADVRPYVEAHLELPANGRLLRSDVQEITCGVPLAELDGLAGYLGLIEPTDRLWTYTLVAIVAQVVPTHRRIEGRLRVQWPGRVRLPDGTCLPEEG